MQQHQLDIIGAIIEEMRATLGDDVFSANAGKQMETRLRLAWGGQAVYVKKSDVDTDARAVQIRQRYNGKNRLDLQEEFGVSRSQFYRMLKGG